MGRFKVVLDIKIVTILLCLLASSFHTKGQEHLLKIIDLSTPQSKTTVFVFLGTDCPISQKYMVRLKNINSKYAVSDMRMIGIFPGKLKQKDLDKFAVKYDVDFPVRLDKNNHFTKTLHAEVTPEVFLLDDAGNLRYQGAIDNWYYELGHYRQGEIENYLIDAIESVLKGVEPKIKKTKAVGCLIQSGSKK